MAVMSSAIRVTQRHSRQSSQLTTANRPLISQTRPRAPTKTVEPSFPNPLLLCVYTQTTDRSSARDTAATPPYFATVVEFSFPQRFHVLNYRWRCALSLTPTPLPFRYRVDPRFRTLCTSDVTTPSMQ
jgi:hypothetical protein